MTDLIDQTQQLNVKLPWALVAGIKRLAAKEGVAVNTYIASVFTDLIAREAETLRAQIDEEQAEVMRERAALMAALDQAEAASVDKGKRKREVKR